MFTNYFFSSQQLLCASITVNLHSDPIIRISVAKKFRTVRVGWEGGRQGGSGEERAEGGRFP